MARAEGISSRRLKGSNELKLGPRSAVSWF